MTLDLNGKDNDNTTCYLQLKMRVFCVKRITIKSYFDNKNN